MERTPDDPDNEPTQMAGYDHPQSGSHREPAAYSDISEDPYPDPAGQQSGWSQPPEPPTPWYLRPLALIGLGVLTAILIAALVWGMVRLVQNDSGPTAPPTTVSSTSATPPGDPAAPGPQPVVPGAPAPETPPPGETSPPPPSTTEPPASTSTTTTPSTTTPPTTPPTTTEAPTTTEPPTTTAAPTTTEAPTNTEAPDSTAPADLPPGQ